MKLRSGGRRGVVLAAGFALAASGPADVPLRSETNYAPAWSPDGTRITFEAKIAGRFAIVVMKADGAGLRPLTTGPADEFASSAVNDWGPAWSPEGTKIAYCSGLENKYEIHVMNADGSSPTRLTFMVHPR